MRYLLRGCNFGDGLLVERIRATKALHSANKSRKIGFVDKLAKGFKRLVTLRQLRVEGSKIDLIDKFNAGDILKRSQVSPGK